MSANEMQHVIDEVIDVLITTLGIPDQAPHLESSTPLFGELPELDSLGVVELAMALETRFDIEIADEDVSAEVFETVATLAEFVTDKRG